MQSSSKTFQNFNRISDLLSTLAFSFLDRFFINKLYMNNILVKFENHYFLRRNLRVNSLESVKMCQIVLIGYLEDVKLKDQSFFKQNFNFRRQLGLCISDAFAILIITISLFTHLIWQVFLITKMFNTLTSKKTIYLWVKTNRKKNDIMIKSERHACYN